MIEVRRATADDWSTLRETRLAALADAPSAFGSTYAQAVEFGEADWRNRLENVRSATFLARLPHLDHPAGMVGGFFDEESVPNTVELVSMWVDPCARGAGAGIALVECVVGWARAERAERMHLWVTDSNDPARRLYERCGFAYNGERQPLPSDPTLDEVGMDLTLR